MRWIWKKTFVTQGGNPEIYGSWDFGQHPQTRLVWIFQGSNPQILIKSSRWWCWQWNYECRRRTSIASGSSSGRFAGAHTPTRKRSQNHHYLQDTQTHPNEHHIKRIKIIPPDLKSLFPQLVEDPAPPFHSWVPADPSHQDMYQVGTSISWYLKFTWWTYIRINDHFLPEISEMCLFNTAFRLFV